MNRVKTDVNQLPCVCFSCISQDPLTSEDDTSQRVWVSQVVGSLKNATQHGWNLSRCPAESWNKPATLQGPAQRGRRQVSPFTRWGGSVTWPPGPPETNGRWQSGTCERKKWDPTNSLRNSDEMLEGFFKGSSVSYVLIGKKETNKQIIQRSFPTASVCVWGYKIKALFLNEADFFLFLRLSNTLGGKEGSRRACWEQTHTSHPEEISTFPVLFSSLVSWLVPNLRPHLCLSVRPTCFPVVLHLFLPSNPSVLIFCLLSLRIYFNLVLSVNC